MTTTQRGPGRAALDLRALMRVNPVEGRKQVLAAFDAAHGNAVHAAELLGIGHRTLLRLMAGDEGIAAGVERIRAARPQKASA